VTLSFLQVGVDKALFRISDSTVFPQWLAFTPYEPVQAPLHIRPIGPDEHTDAQTPVVPVRLTSDKRWLESSPDLFTDCGGVGTHL
jgi:hypothetical protein